MLPELIELGRIPHGMRGLKSAYLIMENVKNCRIPHGMRGLKYRCCEAVKKVVKSHPAWDAWIEIMAKEAT